MRLQGLDARHAWCLAFWAVVVLTAAVAGGRAIVG